ncbi:hypothetical protein BDV95DRAFT_577617 [Massariosphaeria phaeospora]|uniref:Secreted protein n=1 Tax=Massariosphaeria phaeospora TaxID=100035 RepID=A0A7C8I312_9PLEO|nr:hypothetical protein BDV95DRAFT_577617 [Massariosphaeria phaeospora]
MGIGMVGLTMRWGCCAGGDCLLVCWSCTDGRTEYVRVGWLGLCEIGLWYRFEVEGSASQFPCRPKYLELQ